MTLKQDFPEVHGAIRRGMAEDRLQIGFNGYEHAAFTCISPDSVVRQIRKGLEVDRGIWDAPPRGYWPSDCRWDPYVGHLMRDQDLGWVFLHRESVRISNPGGKHYPDWRELDLNLPFSIKCPMQARVPGVVYANINYDLFRTKDTETYFAELETANAQSPQGAYSAIGLDLETLLVLEVKGVTSDPLGAFESFLVRLSSLPYVEFAFTDDVLRLLPPRQELFVRPSYWGHFGGAYPDGVQKILALCDAAERDLIMCEDLLALIGEHPDTDGAAAEIEQAWDHLLIGENSEVRFTDPPTDENSHTFYPTENLVLETYDHAIHAYEAARRLKRRLIEIHRGNRGRT